MPSLWVANPTNQDHDVIIMRIEQQTNRSRYMMRPLPAGQQAEFSNLSTPEITATIDHHRQYGARSIDEVKKEKKIIGLIYSDVREITFGTISKAYEHNIEELDKEGKRLRAAAAIAADKAMLNNTPEGSTLKASVVEMRETAPKDDPNKDTVINETRTIRDDEQKTDRRGHKRPGR